MGERFLTEVMNMPANYAHYRFGKQVLPELPHEVQQSIQRFRRLYDVGLHGPDLFFFHNPFFRTSAGELGHQFHIQTGQEFFTRACGQATSEAARVYLYGVLCHYALDSACHPFIRKMDESGQAGHVPLESEFDRYLLEADGKLPVYSWDQGRHIRLTRGECVTVAGFYPPASPGDIHWDARFMAFSLRFLNRKNRKQTQRILSLLKQSLLDTLIPEEPVEAFARLDSELLARYNRALRDYPRLLEQLLAHLDHGEPLGEEFRPTFG